MPRKNQNEIWVGIFFQSVFWRGQGRRLVENESCSLWFPTVSSRLFSTKYLLNSWINLFKGPLGCGRYSLVQVGYVVLYCKFWRSRKICRYLPWVPVGLWLGLSWKQTLCRYSLVPAGSSLTALDVPCCRVCGFLPLACTCRALLLWTALLSYRTLKSAMMRILSDHWSIFKEWWGWERAVQESQYARVSSWLPSLFWYHATTAKFSYCKGSILAEQHLSQARRKIPRY